MTIAIAGERVVERGGGLGELIKKRPWIDRKRWAKKTVRVMSKKGSKNLETSFLLLQLVGLASERRDTSASYGILQPTHYAH